MNKFFVLLTKEVRELATPAIFLPLVVTMVLFYSLGKISTSEGRRAANRTESVIIIDHDNTDASHQVATVFTQAGFTIQTGSTTPNAASQLQNSTAVALVDIPQGYAVSLTSNQPPKLAIYQALRTLSLIGMRGSSQTDAALAALSSALSTQIIATHSSINPTFVKQPIIPQEHVVVAGREAQISLAQLVNYIQNQIYFIPIILLIVIIFASQFIATSIASEKENKTLETLLSAPISRQAIVTAKLAAAGLMALVFAGVYMIGMRSYIGGLTTSLGAGGAQVSQAVHDAAQQLGLILSVNQMITLGVSLFFGILCGLALALILGAFAEDVKSIQAVITPIMVLVLIPYLLTNFFDISSLSPVAKWLVYAIPFSQPFLAAQALLFGHTSQVWYGMGYEAIFFFVLVMIASRIFSTDAIVTLKFKFNLKRPR